MKFADFSLKVEHLGDRESLVRVLQSPTGQAVGPFTVPFQGEDLESFLADLGGLNRDAVRDLAVTSRNQSLHTAQRVGDGLFRALFPELVRDRFLESWGQIGALPERGLRIRIYMDPREPRGAWLGSIPWEFLFRESSQDFLSLHRKISIVRYLEVPRRDRPAPVLPPLRVAVLIASPTDLPRLKIASEQEMVKKAWQRHGGINLEFLDHVSIEGLQERLRQGGFHILHFIGHGSFDRATGTGSLVFEGSDGRSRLVYGEILANLLKGIDSLRLVVLNACRTATMAPVPLRDAFGGAASALVLGGIPAVVGMQFPISDRAAIKFGGAFYDSLASGDGIDTAVIEGRLAIHSTSPETTAWATPVLFMRLPDGEILGLPKRDRSSDSTVGEEFERGLIRFSLGDQRNAEEDFRQALRLEPRNRAASVYLSLCRMANTPISSLPLVIANELIEGLNASLSSGDAEVSRLARLALGILHVDYYRPKRLQSRGIPTEQLISSLSGINPTDKEKLALSQVRYSRAAARLVGLG